MTGQPAVIGIDPSQTAAGIAIIAGGPQHINWPILLRDVGDTGHRADPWTKRARRIVAQTRRIITVIDQAATELNLDYTLAVIEGPAYANKLPSQFDRAGVFWGLISALDNRSIPIAIIGPTTRAMFATGKGHADKKLVLAETKAVWHESVSHSRSFSEDIDAAISNDNRADALNLASMGAMHLGWTLPFLPRRRHVENVAKCTWPTPVTA